ncbi:MAG: trypsin-like serine protease [Polyangiaceae bacterium]
MAGFASGACGGPASAPPEEAFGTASQAIYGGVLDDGAQANNAVVALTVGSPQDFVLCTATLIAPNVVLTAHHCVGSNLAATVTCDQTGASTSGTQIGADVAPTTIHVFVGAEPDLTYGTPDANGAAIFDTESSTLCNSDIAVVLLDRSIPSITPLALRLTTATLPGETVRAVGYGENDQNDPVGTRFRKDGLSVLAVGPEVSPSGTSLGSNEFELGESTCEGDSGGPAISEETGAVVGVVSRGGACTDDFGHIYTMTSGFSQLITTAMAAAGEIPLEEVIQSDAGAPPKDAGTATATAPSGAPSDGVDAGKGASPPFEEEGGGYSQGGNACASRVAPARGRSGDDWRGLPLVALALATLTARRRRSRR